MEILSDHIKFTQDIPDELVNEMNAHLVPVVKYDWTNGRALTFKYPEKVHPKNVAYTWIREEDNPLVPVLCNGGILPLNGPTQIITFHPWGYYGFFKPSLYEVYCCLYGYMKDDWKMVKHFFLDSNRITDDNWRLAVVGNCHWCPCYIWSDPERGDIL